MVNDPCLVLGADDVRRVFTPAVALQSQRRAFTELGQGRAQLPARLLLDGPEGSTAFCYAARTGPDGAAVSKFGSVSPANAGRGLPTIGALVTVLDAHTGRPAAIMGGTLVTTLRTATASAVAIDALADAGPIAVIGSGVQAAAHLDVLALVRPGAELRLAGRTPDAVRRCADAYAGEVVVGSIEEVCRGAVAVVTTTSSATPVVSADHLDRGTVVMSIGSFAAGRCEVGPDVLARAGLIVVDDVETSLEHAGPIVAAIAAGTLSAADLVTLGDVLVGRAQRPVDADLVFVNSVGIGVQDAAAAEAVVAAARGQGLGTPLAL